MSTSDDIAAQIAALYHIDGDPVAEGLTFLTATGTPNNNWDSSDTAAVGKKFSIGSMVQNTTTNVVYRCSDATPTAAVWRIIIQEDI